MSSDIECTGAPSTAMTTSPAANPARAAGLSLTTAPSRAPDDCEADAGVVTRVERRWGGGGGRSLDTEPSVIDLAGGDELAGNAGNQCAGKEHRHLRRTQSRGVLEHADDVTLVVDQRATEVVGIERGTDRGGRERWP